jgi:hypothetical protein
MINDEKLCGKQKNIYERVHLAKNKNIQHFHTRCRRTSEVNE